MSNEDGTFLGAAQGSRLLHFFHLCTIIQSGELSGLPESIEVPRFNSENSAVPLCCTAARFHTAADLSKASI